MGQSTSTESSLPDRIEVLQDEFFRHARIFSTIASLSYEEFQQCLDSLNELSKKCMDADGKVMVFAVEKGSDSTFLWKGTVRIACVKMDMATKKIESYRLLYLNQFLKVFKSIQTQVAAAQQASSNPSSERPRERVQSDSSSSSPNSTHEACEPFNYSEALMLFEQQVEEAAAGFIDVDKLTECCICLDRKPEVMLPCTHSYCLPCLEQWNAGNKTCPICREALDSTDETWVISDFPAEREINEDICHSLMKLASSPQPQKKKK